MARQRYVARLLRRRRGLMFLTLLAGSASAAAALGGAGASATASAGAPEAGYAALGSTEPTGLPLVTTHRTRSAGDPVGPTWPAQAPAGARSWPVTSSIRRLHLSTPGLSAWIARSSLGGVCVLLYDGVPVDGVSAIDVGCSPAGRLDRGASVEVSDIPGSPGEGIAAGVVPDGVVAVSTPMADGTTATEAVSGNAWSRVTEQPAAPSGETTEITGG